MKRDKEKDEEGRGEGLMRTGRRIKKAGEKD